MIRSRVAYELRKHIAFRLSSQYRHLENKLCCIAVCVSLVVLLLLTGIDPRREGTLQYWIRGLLTPGPRQRIA